MTRKEEATTPAPDWWVIECFMNGMGTVSDVKDWRKRRGWYVDWLKPLVDDGRLRELGDLKYEVTPTGVLWWANDRAKAEPSPIESLAYPRYDGCVLLDGKGIGAEITYRWYKDIAAAQAAIVAGYFELVQYYMYLYSERWITVRLTAAGMRFFDSLPRLKLECA